MASYFAGVKKVGFLSWAVLIKFENYLKYVVDNCLSQVILVMVMYADDIEAKEKWKDHLYFPWKLPPYPSPTKPTLY